MGCFLPPTTIEQRQTITINIPTIKQYLEEQQEPSPIKKSQTESTSTEEKNYAKINIEKFKTICKSCFVTHLSRFLENGYEKEICECNGYGVKDFEGDHKKRCEKCLGETLLFLKTCVRCLGKGYIPN